MEIPRWAVFIFGYFAVQLEQIFGWWVLGMVIGSAVSVFAKDYLPASIQIFTDWNVSRLLFYSVATGITKVYNPFRGEKADTAILIPIVSKLRCFLLT